MISLSHSIGARAFGSAFYGEGTGEILFSFLECSADDTHLDNCSKDYLPIPNSNYFCFHGEDAGVQCNGACTEGNVKLVDGDNMNEGRVEVCKDGIWGTICDQNAEWGTAEARVICRQLNLPYTG